MTRLFALKHRFLHFSLLLLCLVACVNSVFALEKLSDEGMSDVSGAGIAFGLQNFSFQMAPTSYIELTGTKPNSASITCAAAGDPCWKLGNVRYYGLSITSASTGNVTGADWYNGDASPCIAGGDGVGCPLGKSTTSITDFASVYSPFLLRVFQYAGYDAQGNYRNQTTNPASPLTYEPTVLEFIGPSYGDTFRWSFWGAQQIGDGATAGYSTSTAAGGCLNGATTNTAYCGLQSQVIIQGKNIAYYNNAKTYGSGAGDFGVYANPSGAATNSPVTSTTPIPTKLQLMLTQNTADPTLGFVYQSALSGNFRFSAGQAANVYTTQGVYNVPNFAANEGLYFDNVNAYLPLGHLNYQAVTLARSDANGNFQITVTPLQNTANVYNDFYCGATNPVTCFNSTVKIGSQDADAPLYPGDTAAQRGAFNMTEPVVTGITGTAAQNTQGPNPTTHGFVYWGDPTVAASSGTATTNGNGIYFKTSAGVATNIGTARITGLVIQSLQIQSSGATP
jgi:hypothetical protein